MFFKGCFFLRLSEFILSKASLFREFFPKQFTVGVLTAVLSVSALAGMLCPSPWSCVCLVSSHVSQLVSQSPSLLFSLGCCVRLPDLVFVVSPVCLPTCLPVSQLVLQPGMLCPPPWSYLCLVSHLVSILGWSPSSCFSLVSGLVSHVVSHLV